VNWTCEQHTHRSASPVAPLPPTRTDGCNLCPRTTATHVPGPNTATGEGAKRRCATSPLRLSFSLFLCLSVSSPPLRHCVTLSLFSSSLRLFVTSSLESWTLTSSGLRPTFPLPGGEEAGRVQSGCEHKNGPIRHGSARENHEAYASGSITFARWVWAGRRRSRRSHPRRRRHRCRCTRRRGLFRCGGGLR
jgi:hypothetical protein